MGQSTMSQVLAHMERELPAEPIRTLEDELTKILCMPIARYLRAGSAKALADATDRRMARQTMVLKAIRGNNFNVPELFQIDS